MMTMPFYDRSSSSSEEEEIENFVCFDDVGIFFERCLIGFSSVSFSLDDVNELILFLYSFD